MKVLATGLFTGCLELKTALFCDWLSPRRQRPRELNQSRAAHTNSWQNELELVGWGRQEGPTKGRQHVGINVRPCLIGISSEASLRIRMMISLGRWHTPTRLRILWRGCSTGDVVERPTRRRCALRVFNSLPYEDALAMQRRLVSRPENRASEDVLMVLQHPAVFTLGRGSSLDHLKFDPDAPPYHLVRVERGGEVTFHGPGQIVAYPIFNLRHHRKDLRWYVRGVEDVLIRTLGDFGIESGRKEGLTGVWVADTKVGFVGISCSRWITMHGISLNVCPDMSAFSLINPCGISEYPMGSMRDHISGITPEQAFPLSRKNRVERLPQKTAIALERPAPG